MTKKHFEALAARFKASKPSYGLADDGNWTAQLDAALEEASDLYDAGESSASAYERGDLGECHRQHERATGIKERLQEARCALGDLERLIAAAPAMKTALEEAVRWVAKLAADNDEEGNEIGVRAKRQVEKIDALLKEIEG